MPGLVVLIAFLRVLIHPAASLTGFSPVNAAFDAAPLRGALRSSVSCINPHKILHPSHKHLVTRHLLTEHPPTHFQKQRGRST